MSVLLSSHFMDDLNVSMFFNNMSNDQVDEYTSSRNSYFVKLFALSKAIANARRSGVLKPFAYLSTLERMYRLYAQPVVFFVAVTTFILMAFYIRKDKCFKTYVLTMTFMLTDIIGVLLPLPFHFVFLPIDPYYGGVPFRWCEVYRILAAFLPQVLYYQSQWLKFVTCVFQCFYIYYPSKAQWLYRKRFLTILLVVSFLVSTAISSLMHFDVMFQEFSYLNERSNVRVNTCIMVPSAIYDINSRLYNIIRIVAPMTIGIVIPFVFMIAGTIILFLEIQSKSKLLKKQKKNAEADRLQQTRFIGMISLIFIIILIPRLVFEILLIDQISRESFYHELIEMFHLASHVIYHVSVPAIFAVYVVCKDKRIIKIERKSHRKSIQPNSTPM
ncbi:unnamed protein product [Mytilus coruscus]|uniref:G-protein coupled receptors family 1 profile domain-containing protein n=1 Tax=Mytilus coruscus TaxID=42192 RepID=A0A6J8ASN6_MYTCO|nr:unnamed protein product [Mytilus coruscus]